MFVINFAVDTLYEIAIDLCHNLEEMNIFDLKYEVTQRYFERIENEIWGSVGIHFSRLAILRMDPAFKTIQNAYWNYQHEIRTYLKVRKEKEIKILEKKERNIREELEIVEFRHTVLEHISNKPKDIISITEIIHSNGAGMVYRGLTGTQINIIKNICEFRRCDYQFGGHHLFKRALIEEIEKLLYPEMDYETVKGILLKKGINEEGVLT